MICEYQTPNPIQTLIHVLKIADYTVTLYFKTKIYSLVRPFLYFSTNRFAQKVLVSLITCITIIKKLSGSLAAPVPT